MKKRKALCILLLAAGLVFWGKGRLLVRSAGTHPGYWLQFAGEQELAPSTRLQLEEEETGSFVFARQEQAVEAKAPLLGRGGMLPVIHSFGDADLLLSGQPLLAGSYPRADTNQCAVDRQTAWDLWGGLDVLGNFLLLGEEEYTVCGVVESAERFALISWNGGERFAFTHAAYLPASGTVLPRRELDRFTGGYGFAPPKTVSRPVAEAGWLLEFTQLPLWILGLLLGERLIRQTVCGHGRMSRWGRWLLRLAAVLLLGAALGFSPPLSPESLPARWSNFAFWRESARTVWDRLLTAWTLPGLLPRYELWARYSLPALLCTAAACILVGAGAGLWTARPRRGERE